MDRRLILSLLLAAASAPALAAEHGAKEGEKEAKDKNGLYFDIPQVGLPVIVQGRVVNYVFCAIRLNLQPSANVPVIRSKEPYIRDALVKAAVATPFTLANNWMKLDEVPIRKLVQSEVTRMVGPGNIASIRIIQNPQKHIASPPA